MLPAENIPDACARLLRILPAATDAPRSLADIPVMLRNALAACERRKLAWPLVWYSGRGGGTSELPDGSLQIGFPEPSGWFHPSQLTHRPAATHARRTALGDAWIDEQAIADVANPNAAPRGRQTTGKDDGRRLSREARFDLVRSYIRDKASGRWSGTLSELKAALKRDTGLAVSTSTLSRALRGTRLLEKNSGLPRTMSRTGEREAVAPSKLAGDEGAADAAGVDAYVMPDDAE